MVSVDDHDEQIKRSDSNEESSLCANWILFVRKATKL